MVLRLAVDSALFLDNEAVDVDALDTVDSALFLDNGAVDLFLDTVDSVLFLDNGAVDEDGLDTVDTRFDEDFSLAITDEELLAPWPLEGATLTLISLLDVGEVTLRFFFTSSSSSGGCSDLGSPCELRDEDRLDNVDFTGGHFFKPEPEISSGRNPVLPVLPALVLARSTLESRSNLCTMEATDNCCRNLSSTGFPVVARMSSCCWMFCTIELIRLWRRRGLIGLFEAEGIFSMRSSGSLENEEKKKFNGFDLHGGESDYRLIGGKKIEAITEEFNYF